MLAIVRSACCLHNALYAANATASGRTNPTYASRKDKEVAHADAHSASPNQRCAAYRAGQLPNHHRLQGRSKVGQAGSSKKTWPATRLAFELHARYALIKQLRDQRRPREEGRRPRDSLLRSPARRCALPHSPTSQLAPPARGGAKHSRPAAEIEAGRPPPSTPRNRHVNGNLGAPAPPPPA